MSLRNTIASPQGSIQIKPGFKKCIKPNIQLQNKILIIVTLTQIGKL